MRINGPRPFESFASELARGVYSQFRSNGDFARGVVEHVVHHFVGTQ
jgi:hypothetical protein